MEKPEEFVNAFKDALNPLAECCGNAGVEHIGNTPRFTVNHMHSGRCCNGRPDCLVPSDHDVLNVSTITQMHRTRKGGAEAKGALQVMVTMDRSKGMEWM